MNIFGPQFNPPPHRIQPVDDHPDDQESDSQRRRQTRHRGRLWNQKKKGDVEPTFPEKPAVKEGHGIFNGSGKVEEAKRLFANLLTLEEKVAQLCFYQTEAVYDTSIQQHVELLIQAWQIGGLLFTKGQYRRQGYLIERYQELSKTALLIGNDFLHGLSFYFEGEKMPDLNQPGLEKRFSDLGKAVMGLNRRLSVHFQFDQQRSHEAGTTKEQIGAFRKGVRQALGIVARHAPPKKRAPSRTLESSISVSLDGAQEHIGLKSLNFLDLTEERIYEEKLVKAFKESYDVLLFGSNIQDAIRMICRVVKSGRISESEIDRRVMKLLILKSQYT
ncbi:MAG: hypothetical protein S4CHLAM81_13640 [Chlamydiales bacterium]|nr:hypothetical protein [Chlamydiales bacterium]MCH9636136.1 hypothetical protein [Chlamydiales bacterium]MCH9703409.1 hypothetical protein [Chlamydiota bacterium]